MADRIERVAIVGSRAHPNLETVRDYVETLPRRTIVISGGADGVDTMAREVALGSDLDVIEYTVEVATFEIVCKLHSPSRPTLVKRLGVSPNATLRDLMFFRNTWIAVSCTRMVAFPAESAGGTWDAIRQAKRFDRPVEER
jgi:hypothetical protein